MHVAGGRDWGADMNMTGEVTLGRRLLRWGSVICLAAWLAGCGGGSSGDEGQPPIDTGGVTIGAGGGTVTDVNGAAVIVPAGAFTAEATIRVAMDSSGAPVLPEGLVAAGNTYVITPHGGDFGQPVEVRIPAPNVTLQPNQELKLAKAQPGGEWVVLGDSELRDGVLSAQVSSFSYFVPVTLTYLLPLAQIEPFAITSSNLDCAGQDCLKLVGLATVTWTVTTNNGQLPANCSNAMHLKMGRGTTSSSLSSTGFSFLPLTGGSFTASAPADRSTLTLVTGLSCNGPPSFSRILRSVGARRAYQPPYPGLSVVNAPAQLNVVAGLRADLDVVFNGGPSKWVPASASFAAPAPTNRAEIDWQRSDDEGASWRVVARSYQDEADPSPMGSTVPWSTWSLRHGFVASAADQGALIRVRACYTPPDVPAPPCVTGAATRINVIQQSALPAIVDAPRSMLVRSGQTASLSATAVGAPAPTLQWQTRAANDNGAWADVAGATGGSHTTAVLALADNGRQYRVVASNPLGSAASAGVTVSVSDVDVAPSISSQPAALSVVAGSEAVFAVVARGTEALSYQWRRNGVAITGANAPVLKLAAVSEADATGYSVQVSNTAGTVTSDAALLSVSAGVAPAVAPTIVTQPVSVLVNSGNTATFAVGVSGSGPLSYQWLRNGSPISGATSAFYSMAAATIGDAATYAVQVSNSVGSETSWNVVLTVIQSEQPAAVTLVSHPSPQIQSPGGSATFAVAVTGSGPISYQWLKNGAPITGAISGVLTLTGIVAEDAASYSVTVGNGQGSVTSNAATLTVLGVPAISAQPVATTAVAGDTASFSVAATGAGLRYQWLRNNVAIAGATQASYTTLALTEADSGAVFSVLVYNGAGVVFSSGAALTVTAAPARTLALVANSNANTLSIFRADAGTGSLSALGTTGTGAYPYAIAITPNGQFAYVTNLVGNNVSSYSIDAVAGTVTMVGSSVSSVNPYGIAIDPLGRFVWAVNYSASTVSAYTINGSTGQLTAAGPPVATGSLPYAVAVHPSGNYVYVANEMGNSVSAYSVNTSTGQLTLLAGTIANSAYRPHSIAVDPTGRFVYVTESGGSGVAAFSINAGTGVLTVIGYVNSGGSSPSAVAVHPNGQFVYVANQGASTVAMFSVNSVTGALTAVGAPIATGSSPTALSLNAAGSHLYVANQGANSASAFGVDAGTGALTSLGASVATGSGPQGIAVMP
jgi:6-phosphogluconolactonase (cycloisomerase 2 family)